MTTEEMVAVLKPIIDRWNEIHDDDWGVEVDSDTVEIKSDSRFPDYMNGTMVTEIAGVCFAFGWTWHMSSWDGRLKVRIY